MAKPVLIMSDSVCDLSADLLKRFQIKVLPLTVNLGNRSYKDGQALTPEAIYEAYRRERLLPQTAAISPQEFMDAFTPWLQEGYEIVHLDISAELSACHQNAIIAAGELGGVFPVDTRHLSTGQGLVVLEACRLRDQGLSAAEVAQGARDFVRRVRTSFVLDTLEYMWKGGRCSGFTALGANLLNIKPCLEMQKGLLKVCKKYRGSMEKVYLQYVRERMETENIDPNYVFITHSGGVSEETLTALKEVVREAVHPKELLVTTAGCTVTSHCGPGTLGVLFAVGA